VRSLILFFWQMCLLRRAPQDLPASINLLGLLGALNVLVGAVGTVDYFGGPGRALTASVLDTALVSALVYATLAFARHRPRFVQTLTAVFGVGSLFGAALLPVQWLAAGSGLMLLFGLVNLVVLGWIHVVLGHVLRHALEMDLWAGIAIAVGYTVIGLTVVNTYLPPPGAGAG
jgi:hypothetical protein